MQNLTFVDGNSTGETLRGRRRRRHLRARRSLKVVNSRFFGNRCDPTGPDLGGAAVRVLSQYNEPAGLRDQHFGGTLHRRLLLERRRR